MGKQHSLFSSLPSSCFSTVYIQQLVGVLSSNHACIGNFRIGSNGLLTSRSHSLLRINVSAPLHFVAYTQPHHCYSPPLFPCPQCSRSSSKGQRRSTTDTSIPSKQGSHGLAAPLVLIKDTNKSNKTTTKPEISFVFLSHHRLFHAQLDKMRAHAHTMP